MLRTHVLWLTLLCGIATVNPGCSANHVPPAVADGDQALQILTHVLDTWQLGRTAESLHAQVPSIRAVDDDWRAGCQLQSYFLEEIPDSGGVAARFYATLQLSGPAGTYTQVAEYLVSTNPIISVIRHDAE